MVFQQTMEELIRVCRHIIIIFIHFTLNVTLYWLLESEKKSVTKQHPIKDSNMVRRCVSKLRHKNVLIQTSR